MGLRDYLTLLLDISLGLIQVNVKIDMCSFYGNLPTGATVRDAIKLHQERCKVYLTTFVALLIFISIHILIKMYSWEHGMGMGVILMMNWRTTQVLINSHFIRLISSLVNWEGEYYVSSDKEGRHQISLDCLLKRVEINYLYIWKRMRVMRGVDEKFINMIRRLDKEGWKGPIDESVSIPTEMTLEKKNDIFEDVDIIGNPMIKHLHDNIQAGPGVHSVCNHER